MISKILTLHFWKQRDLNDHLVTTIPRPKLKVNQFPNSAHDDKGRAWEKIPLGYPSYYSFNRLAV